MLGALKPLLFPKRCWHIVRVPTCGGPGLWRRIAHLDMSDPDQQCPSNWRLITTPVRACGCTSSACDSAVASHIHACVEESKLSSKGQLMDFLTPLQAWKVLMLTVSLSLTGLQVCDNTFGPSLLHMMTIT